MAVAGADAPNVLAADVQVDVPLADELQASDQLQARVDLPLEDELHLEQRLDAAVDTPRPADLQAVRH